MATAMANKLKCASRATHTLRQISQKICLALWAAMALSVSPVVHAATVEIVITGQWQFFPGSDPNLVDPKNLDGADGEYRFRYDDSQMSVYDESQPFGTPGFCAGELSTTCTFFASGSLSFTNRPGAMADVIGSFGGQTLAQVFVATDPGLPLIWRMILPTPESGIFANTGFGRISWGTPMSSGSGISVNNPMSSDDFALLNMDLNAVTLFPNGAYRYVLADAQWSVATVVPVPAGLWLFGSALLVLLGRRRA